MELVPDKFNRPGLPRLPRLLLAVSAAVCAGAILAALTLQLGVVAVGAVVAVIVFPWFVREPFRLYLWLLVTWPLLSLYLQISLPGGVPDISYERVLIPLTAALVILAALTLRTKIPGIVPLVIIYVTAQIVSYGLAFGGQGFVKPDLVILLNSLVLPIIVYWLTKVFMTSTGRLKLLLFALIAGSLIICMTGFYERALDLRESPFPVTTGTASGERYLGVPGGRAAGVMGNPAIYGAVVAVGALAAAACSAHAARLSSRFGFGAATFILTYGVAVSYTRSAWLAFLAALLVAQFLIKGLWRMAVLVVVAGILAVSFLVFTEFDQILGNILLDNPVVQDRVLEQDNVSGRVDRMAFAWEKVWERPLLGWGPGALDHLTGQVFPDGGFDTSHNTYLTFLVDGGLFVFLSFTALVTFWLVRAFQALRLSAPRSVERSVLGVMLGAMLIFLLSGMALELKYFGYFNSLFWIAGATIEQVRSILLADRHNARESMGVRWPAH